MTQQEVKNRLDPILHEELMAMLKMDASMISVVVAIPESFTLRNSAVFTAAATALVVSVDTYLAAEAKISLEMDNINAIIQGEIRDAAYQNAHYIPNVTIIGDPVIKISTPFEIKGTPPLTKPLSVTNASDEDYPNAISITIDGKSMMIVDGPPLPNNGGGSSLNFNNAQTYGLIPPGIDPNDPPTSTLISPTSGSGPGSGSGVYGSSGNPGGTNPTECGGGVTECDGTTECGGSSECGIDTGVTDC